MYKGFYNGTKKHEADLGNVLSRAWKLGLEKVIVTGTSLKESEEAVTIANTDGKPFKSLWCTGFLFTLVLNVLNIRRITV